MQLIVARTWNGHSLPPEHLARVRLGASEGDLVVDVDAPFHGDPAPSPPPGSTERLWEHEVVELFLVGESARYLEIELGPHGHHLVLSFQAQRVAASTALAIEYTASIDGKTRRWAGRARIPRSLLPAGLRAANAFAIHGPAGARQHAAAFPLPGARPDFHPPEAFPQASFEFLDA